MENKVLFTASTQSHIVNFHLPYLRRFHKLGWTVHVACGDLRDNIPWADETIGLPFEKRMLAPGNLKAAGLLRKKIRREQYGLICTHTSLAAFFTRLALTGLRERPRVVNVVHGYLFDDDSSWYKRSLLLAAERWTAPKTDLLLTMNRWDDELARKHRLGARVERIPGIGVDFSRFQSVDSGAGDALRKEWGIASDAFVLLYAAEFSGRKSQAVLIRAMEKLPEQTILVLPGDGALLPQCRELARELGLECRILFPGHVREMPRWYAMADAAVSASRSEGLPFNVMEAMYAGLPVVASAVKGHEDLLCHGESGLLYPYGDTESFSQCIMALLADRKLGPALAARARKHVERYQLDQVLPLVMALYLGENRSVSEEDPNRRPAPY